MTTKLTLTNDTWIEIRDWLDHNAFNQEAQSMIGKIQDHLDDNTERNCPGWQPTELELQPIELAMAIEAMDNWIYNRVSGK